MANNQTRVSGKPLLNILVLLSVCHCCNDAMQAVVNSLYPIIKDDLMLNFYQIGLVTLCYQLSASVLQPLMGLYLDYKPNPWFITLAAVFTFTGLICLAYANSLVTILCSVVLVGAGSSIVHPEASRLTSLASGGRKGLAQSLFQVGGNLGSSIGPLLAALFIAPYGRSHTTSVAFMSVVGVIASLFIARWYKKLLKANGSEKRSHKILKEGDEGWIKRPYSNKKTYFYIVVLIVLIISKYVYMASMSSYFTFYTIEKFGLSTQDSQYALFVFVFATALGTLAGGPIGDKIGRKYVIWASILGATPFTLALPYADLTWTLIFSFGAGFMLSSAFPAIVIMAQELLPNRVGMISGLFFGFAFGIAGIAAAYWGGFAEVHGIEAVFRASSYAPLLGLVAIFLPRR
ncbi:MAG: MFS transporter [Rikenellaceae bacterium]